MVKKFVYYIQEYGFKLMLLVFAFLFVVYMGGVSIPEEERRLYALFDEALTYVHRYHVDAEQISLKHLIYGAIQGMVSSLNDEMSLFLDAEDMQKLKEQLGGSYVGIGVYLEIFGEYPVITYVQDASPALFAGLLKGDKIMNVDDKSLRGLSYKEVLKLIKGEKGSNVTLRVMRNNEQLFKTVVVKRDDIKVKAVRMSWLEDKVGYIRIMRFQRNTADELRELVKYFMDEKGSKLILDLRNNFGGIFLQALEVTSMFLREGMIVFTGGKNGGGEVKKYFVKSEEFVVPETIPMVVLVNEETASASEIVAGALLDTRRAWLIGQKTYGKGSMQSIFELTSSLRKVAMKLTTQYFFTPEGSQIQKKGIMPNMEVRKPEFSQSEMKFIYHFRDELKKFFFENQEYQNKDVEEWCNKRAIFSQYPKISLNFILRWLDEKRRLFFWNVKVLDFSKDPEIIKALEYLNGIESKDLPSVKVFK